MCIRDSLGAAARDLDEEIMRGARDLDPEVRVADASGHRTIADLSVPGADPDDGGFEPVSYTHLDVYKRQAVALAADLTAQAASTTPTPSPEVAKIRLPDIVMIPGGTFAMGGTEISEPVSYTHLDVYKRQALRWPRSACPIS